MSNLILQSKRLPLGFFSVGQKGQEELAAAVLSAYEEATRFPGFEADTGHFLYDLWLEDDFYDDMLGVFPFVNYELSMYESLETEFYVTCRLSAELNWFSEYPSVPIFDKNGEFIDSFYDRLNDEEWNSHYEYVNDISVICDYLRLSYYWGETLFNQPHREVW